MPMPFRAIPSRPEVEMFRQRVLQALTEDGWPAGELRDPATLEKWPKLEEVLGIELERAIMNDRNYHRSEIVAGEDEALDRKLDNPPELSDEFVWGPNHSLSAGSSEKGGPASAPHPDIDCGIVGADPKLTAYEFQGERGSNTPESAGSSERATDAE